jgi:hypothetical protein
MQSINVVHGFVFSFTDFFRKNINYSVIYNMPLKSYVFFLYTFEFSNLKVWQLNHSKYLLYIGCVHVI